MAKQPKTRTVECTPTWEATAIMLIRMVHHGSTESRLFAENEIVRMGKIIDQQTEVSA